MFVPSVSVLKGPPFDGTPCLLISICTCQSHHTQQRLPGLSLSCLPSLDKDLVTASAAALHMCPGHHCSHNQGWCPCRCLSLSARELALARSMLGGVGWAGQNVRALMPPGEVGPTPDRGLWANTPVSSFLRWGNSDSCSRLSQGVGEPSLIKLIHPCIQSLSFLTWLLVWLPSSPFYS